MPTPSRIVVVGASAGGLQPLKRSMNGLPANFPGAVLVVLHIPAQAPSLLASILDRNGQLPAASECQGVLAASDEGSDAGLWSLLRAYQEQSMLLRHGARAATNDPPK